MVNEFGSWKWTISHIFSMHLHITLLLIHLLLYPLKETHQDLITTMEEICRPQTINIITGCIFDQQLRLKDVIHKLPDITSSVHLFRLWSIESVLGEIWVEKVDFRVDLVGIWTLFGSQPPHPPTFGRDLPKKRCCFLLLPLCITLTLLSINIVSRYVDMCKCTFHASQPNMIITEESLKARPELSLRKTQPSAHQCCLCVCCV